LFDEIISKYILDGSINQINIGGDEKNGVLEIQKKKNTNDFQKAFTQIEGNIKRELESDSFKRFLRTKEANLLLKKYEKDEVIAKKLKQKRFPYSNKDFEMWIITEKDVQLLNSLIQDSFDYKISFIDLKTKKTGYYSFELDKFLPNYNEAKNSAIIKIECLFECSVPTLFYSCFPGNKVHKKTMYEEVIKKYSHEDLIRINDENKDECKLPPINTNFGKRSVSITVEPMYVIKELSFVPILRSYYVSSLTFDPKNEILTIFSKFCGEENKKLEKSSKSEFKVNDKTITRKTGVANGFLLYQMKKINSNTSQLTIIIIGKIT
jgi:hypothetical protein